jgi:hypothetical protein
MSASVKPDIDYSKLEDLRKRVADLTDVDLPAAEDVGRRAGETVDRLLRRQRRRTAWPQILAVAGLITVIGLLMAWLSWGRRSPWATGGSPGPESEFGGDEAGRDGRAHTGAEMAWSSDRPASGLTAAEASLTSTGETDDRA